MAEEPYSEQLERVRLMADPDSGTWDLSDADYEALQAVLARLDTLEQEHEDPDA